MEKIHLIANSLHNLQTDFTGFSFRPELLIANVYFFLFVFLLFYILYGIGKITERVCFKDSYNPILSPFIKFALGFIIVATSFFMLGFASELTTTNALVLLFILLLISITEFINYPERIAIQEIVRKPNAIKLFSIVFILIAFLRLIPPQTAGDPLDYHLRFPRVYLNAHSMMIPPLGDESYTTVPHLPEMLYLLTQIVSNGWMSHVVHFGFFIMIFLLLYNVNIFYRKKKSLGPISGLMFISAPLLIQIGTQAFSDLPALFCFIVSCEILILSQYSTRSTILSGVLLGAALASKIWMLYYFPFVILFFALLLRDKGIGNKIKKTILFVISSLVVVLPWYIRGFLLAGNPFYLNVAQGQTSQSYSLLRSFLDNYTAKGFVQKFQFSFEFGFFMYLGILVFFLFLSKTKKQFEPKFYLLLFLIFIPAIIFPLTIGQGRYALPYMVLLYFPASLGLSMAIHKYYGKLIVFSLFTILAIYYLLNTLITLPYGLGWADKDSYLRRNLIMDPVSYYDFNGQFTKNLRSFETVANYGVSEMYYADFKYKNVFYFVDQSKHMLSFPVAIKKLLIRGGNFNWFCRIVQIKNCSDYQASLITRDLNAKQYLYNIKYVGK